MPLLTKQQKKHLLIAGVTLACMGGLVTNTYAANLQQPPAMAGGCWKSAA